MKKILAFILAMSFIFSLTACSEKKTSSETESSSKISNIPCTACVEPEIKEKFTDFSWPTYGNATLLPSPDWCTRGKSWVDDEEGYSAYVDNTTKDQFDSYVKKVYESGFNSEYSNQNNVFTGKTTDGINVYIKFYDDNVMFVDVWIEPAG